MPSEADTDRRDSEPLDALRTEEGHHHHHARGDVGGEYHDGGDEHIKAGQRAREKGEGKKGKDAQPVLIVVMGVSGCGKSTFGEALALALGIPFVDGDTLHPQLNIDKMSSGTPLTDADRQPWLESIRAEAVKTCKEQAQTESRTHDSPRGLVVGCSALKRSYRDILRGLSQSSPESSTSASPSSLPTYFVHIHGSREELLKRMKNRKGHFMKSSMLDSQLETLEPPDETGEPKVVVVELEQSVEDQIEHAREGLRKLGLGV